MLLVLADVASGCVLSLLMVAACLMVCVPRDAFTSAQEEDRCLLRAALVIYVLGLLVAVVAIVLLAMKTHRVTSLTPDPTCEPWAGSCQEGGQRSDGRTECDDCSDEISTCVDLSADGYWWSERGARYFPASEKYGRYWGWGRTRRLNGAVSHKNPPREQMARSVRSEIKNRNAGGRRPKKWVTAGRSSRARPSAKITGDAGRTRGARSGAARA